MLHGSLDWRGVWGRMDTCICMAESLRCSPETSTTLLLAIPQCKMFLVLKKIKMKKKIVVTSGKGERSSKDAREWEYRMLGVR